MGKYGKSRISMHNVYKIQTETYQSTNAAEWKTQYAHVGNNNYVSPTTCKLTIKIRVLYLT